MPESIDDALTEGENFDGKGTSELNNLKSVGADKIGTDVVVINAGDDAQQKLSNLVAGQTVIFTTADTYTVNDLGALPDNLTVYFNGATLQRTDTNPLFEWGGDSVFIGGTINGGGNAGSPIQDDIDSTTGRETTFINTTIEQYGDPVTLYGTVDVTFITPTFNPQDSTATAVRLAESNYPDSVRQLRMVGFTASNAGTFMQIEAIEDSQIFGNLKPSVDIGYRYQGQITGVEVGGVAKSDGPRHLFESGARVTDITLATTTGTSVNQGINGLSTPTGAMHTEADLVGNPTVTITGGRWDVSTGVTFSDQSSAPDQFLVNIAGGRAIIDATFEGGRVWYPDDALWGALDLSNAKDLTADHTRQGPTTVDTSATEILQNQNDNFTLLVKVVGGDGTNRFYDLVLFGRLSSPAVVSENGGVTKTYSRNGAALELAMDSGTYEVSVAAEKVDQPFQ